MPVATLPDSLRSMCQLSVSPALFLRVKAKTALPCLMASLRSSGLESRAEAMASKATEEGNLSVARAPCQHFRSHRSDGPPFGCEEDVGIRRCSREQRVSRQTLPPRGGTGWWIDRLRTVGETHGCGVGVCGGGGGGEKDGQRLWNERWGKERDQREAFSSGGVGEISIV